MPLVGRVCLGQAVPSAGAVLSFYLVGSGLDLSMGLPAKVVV